MLPFNYKAKLPKGRGHYNTIINIFIKTKRNLLARYIPQPRKIRNVIEL